MTKLDQYTVGLGGSYIEAMVRARPGYVTSVSKNLAGLNAYASRCPVVCVITQKDEVTNCRGILRVVYADGSIGVTEFRSHAIMIDWVRTRRAWRGAEFRHLSGDAGYFTSPGYIADLPLKPAH